MATLQQQKQDLEQRLQMEIADLHGEKQQAASEAAHALQVIFDLLLPFLQYEGLFRILTWPS